MLVVVLPVPGLPRRVLGVESVDGTFSTCPYRACLAIQGAKGLARPQRYLDPYVFLASVLHAASKLIVACGKNGPSCSTIAVLETFSITNGSLQVALALSTAPPPLTKQLPVAQPAARPLALAAAQTSLAQPAAAAVALTTAAPVALAAVAVTETTVALAATTTAALAEPAPPHATTTSATTTKKSRRAGQ